MDLKDYVENGRPIAYVTVGFHRCWSFVCHTTEGVTSATESHQRPTAADLEACATRGIPVLRFDRAPSFEVAAACSYSLPLRATGDEPFDTEPHPGTGTWTGFQKVPYLRALRMLEEMGIPVEWNGAKRPELVGADAATVARLQARLRREGEERLARAAAEASEMEA